MRIVSMQTRSSQQGYILISTIIIVLLITMLALAGVSFNSTQTRIATNSKDGQIAFQTAEVVLRQVSDIVQSGAFAPVGKLGCGLLGAPVVPTELYATCVGSGLTAATDNEIPLWQTANAPWLAVLPNGTTTFQGGSSQPGAYIVEGMPTNTNVPGSSAGLSLRPYRITVEAWGGVNGAPPQVMLQSIAMGPI
jgi:type IV pilus assembly protein PilX